MKGGCRNGDLVRPGHNQREVPHPCEHGGLLGTGLLLRCEIGRGMADPHVAEDANQAALMTADGKVLMEV